MPEGPALPVPPGLVEAFRAFEQALAQGDASAWLADSPTTLYGDEDGLLVGRDAHVRPSTRRVVRTHVQVTDPDHALVVAVTEHASGGRGQQTQLWARTEDGWRITATHVTEPAPALDTRIWRVVGDPLVPGAPAGPLVGESVAVKDVIAVAGQVVGAGNPTWEAGAPVERADATVVDALVEAGASIRGIARTDEFAYSLAGTNPHHGTPPNPRAPHCVPGGSSSGPASAVSLGHASIGLGTDTAGSIRVPAAYQGLAGFRPTHGAVPMHGVLALAPTFDTVGWLARDARLLREVGEVLLPDDPRPGGSDLVVVPELLAAAEPDVRTAIEGWVADQGLVVREAWPLGEHDAWVEAFEAWQGWEAWAVRGGWLADRLDSLGGDVRTRFRAAASVEEAEAQAAHDTIVKARARITDLLGDRVLVLPTTPSVAPRPGRGLEAVRASTLRLTTLASIAGAPAVSLPLTTRDGLPCGVSLLAAPGRDRALLDLAVSLG